MALQQPQKTAEQRLQEILERSRLRTGGFSSALEDVGSNIPFIIPGGGVPQVTAQAPTNNINIDYPNPEPYNFNIPEWQMPEQQWQPQENQSVIGSFLQTYNPSIQPVAQNEDGSVVLPDGSTISPSGEIRNSSGQIIEGVASLPGGYTLYSDGSVRRGGLEELVYNIFGSNQAITQEYGNYNPSIEPGSGYNLGTDIRTRDIQSRGNFLPDDVQVVQILQDDGTQWGEQTGHQGYGNSILVALPTGEMLRFSHLAQLPEGIQEGSVIPAGTNFIYPGSTGNVTGEHLDLEYYNANGQIDNPINFQGFSNVRHATGEVVPLDQLTPEIQEAVKNTQYWQGQIPNASIDPTMQQEPTMTEQVQEAVQQPAQTTANLINQVKPTGSFDLGITEALSGEPQKAREAFSGTFERTTDPLPTTGRIDLGLSELARGDTAGARSVQAATARNVGSKLPFLEPITDRISQGLIPDVYASADEQEINPNRTSFGEDIRQGINDIKYQAGQGVNRLKSLFSTAGGENAGLFSRISPADINQKREVGEVSGGGNVLSPQETPQQLSSQAPNDIRDPFFRFGQSASFEKYIDPRKAESGALTTDLFSSDFYSDPKNIQSVFEGTSLAPKAQSIYIDQVKDQYRRKFGDSNEYDQADVDRILNSIGDVPLGFSPQLPEPKRIPKQKLSLGDYLAMGKTVDQWFAEVEGQDKLDSLRRNHQSDKDIIDRYGTAPSPQRVRDYGSTSGRGTQAVTYTQPSGSTRTVIAAPGNELRADSGGNVQQVESSQFSTPIKSPSAQLSYSAQNSGGGLFSRAANFAKNIFTRFLN